MGLLARHQFTVTDQAGNVIPAAYVEVRKESDNSLVPVYSDRDGASPIGNPFLADSEGYVGFHVPGGAYKIKAYKNGFSREQRYVGIGTSAEHDIDNMNAIATSIVSFGAVGDDGTDNTAFIEAALESGIKELAVPEGIFRANGINMPSNVRLFGPGTLKLIGAKADFSSFISFDGVSDSSVEVGEIIVDRSTYPTINSVVCAGASERCKVKGTHFSQSGRWAWFNFGGTIDCGIEDCRIENFEQSALHHNLAATDAAIRPFARRNTIIADDTITGLVISADTGVVGDTPIIEDNVIYGNGAPSFGLFGGPSNGTARIKRNYVEGTVLEMLLGDGEITDNVLVGTGHSTDFGMSFTPGFGGPVYNTHVARNTIIGAGASGINWGGETTTRGVIEENYILDCNQAESTNYNGAGISVGEYGVSNLLCQRNAIVSTDGKMVHGIAEGTISAGIIANNRYENNTIVGAAKADYRIIGAGSTVTGDKKVIRKTSTESVSSDTTLSDDAVLKFPVKANTSYRFCFCVHYGTPTAADFKFDLNGPASPTGMRIVTKALAPDATADAVAVFSAFAFGPVVLTATTNLDGYVVIEGFIDNGANAGTVAFRWAQNSSNGSATAVHAGSFVEYTEIPLAS